MSKPARVVVVEDDQDLRFLLEQLIRKRGHEVSSCATAEDALALLEVEEFDTVVTDLSMPGMDGLELCARIRAAHPNVGLVVISACGDLSAALSAMRLGASDFITKPIQFDHLERAIVRAGRTHRKGDDLKRLTVDAPREAFSSIAGSSAAIMNVIQQLRRIAASDCTVLVTGESGTGKELVARTLHEHGPRSQRPFVAINCAAIPSDLLESELFGHNRGSFTGASHDQPGLFVTANGGTMFLDEVGAMPLELQAKLLRALQERTARAVGAQTELPFDVRIIAAANQDLDRAVKHGAFRRDLLFRLDVMRIHLPPLRERERDAVELAERFLKEYGAKVGKRVSGFTADTIDRIATYAWPGNVRELENCVQAAVTMAQQEYITLDDLPTKVRKARKFTPVQAEQAPALPLLEEIEREHIDRVLKAVHGNKAAAARILGINRVTLYRKLAQVSERTA